MTTTTLKTTEQFHAAIRARNWSLAADLIRPVLVERYTGTESGGDALCDWLADGCWTDLAETTIASIAREWEDAAP
jgi:hypothetical protein